MSVLYVVENPVQHNFSDVLTDTFMSNRLPAVISTFHSFIHLFIRQ
jgi:hypothetical protein